ncbi:MAG: undecaprenyl-diphosphate phosphatase [Pseudomonadota bacterium]
MDWIQIVVLALVQGITEFLPISSSGHLILPAQLTDWPDQGLAFDVGVHFGTLLAVVIYFRNQLIDMAADLITWPSHQNYTPHIDEVLKLAIATIPVVIVGFLAKDFIEANLRTGLVIATTTTAFALLLWWADRKPDSNQMISFSQAAIIGAAQVLALVPGTSRSGITITAALLLGLSRTRAAEFSFLLAIPTIAGAQLLLTLDLLEGTAQANWSELFSGALLAGVSAYLCINAFIALVERTGMLPYVIYRLLLGAFLFFFFLTR